uniref:Uncharacterized protein n=1 Tax=Anopheles atroparvus TaxID=41427 RepID=A0A182JM46_ANOAO
MGNNTNGSCAMQHAQEAHDERRSVRGDLMIDVRKRKVDGRRSVAGLDAESIYLAAWKAPSGPAHRIEWKQPVNNVTFLAPGVVVVFVVVAGVVPAGCFASAHKSHVMVDQLARHGAANQEASQRASLSITDRIIGSAEHADAEDVRRRRLRQTHSTIDDKDDDEDDDDVDEGIGRGIPLRCEFRLNRFPSTEPFLLMLLPLQ